jgi:trimeric autotransporter adhesin
MTAAGHQPSVPTQAVFIDSRIPSLRALIDGVTPGTAIFVLNNANHGPRQIADILAAESLQNLTSIALVGPGSAGHIDLGATRLDEFSLSKHSQALAQVGTALVPGGNILIFGCPVGGGSAGRSFIAELSRLTGANVAAATHRMGGASAASWNLDATIDPVAVRVPFGERARSNDHPVLAGSCA